MNYILSFFMIIATVSAWSQSKPKAMLFIDTNNATTEVAAAKKFAKERGLKLIVFPNKENAKDDLTIENNQGLEKRLKEIDLTTLTISGHNGGAEFAGDNTSVSLSQVVELVEKSGAKESIKSLYLLGCNAGNKAKLFFWKGSLPNLKFVMGYDGSAPLSADKAGVAFYEDVLKKEEALLEKIDAAELKTCLEGIKNVNLYPASLLVSCKEDDYLFLPKRSSEEKFGKLDTKECIQKNIEYKEKYIPELLKYWSGEKEGPVDTSSGFLREAYTFLRQNEHCFGNSDDGLSELNGDSLLFLLFNKKFNQNAVTYFRPIFDDILEEYRQVIDDPEAFKKIKIQELEQTLKILNSYKENPEMLAKSIKAELKQLKSAIDTIKADPLVIGCQGEEAATPRCSHVVEKLVQGAYLEMLQDRLSKSRVDVDTALVNVSSQITVVESFIGNTTVASALKEKIQKMISAPANVTRKEIMEVDHLQSEYFPFGIVTKKAIAMAGIMNSLASLDRTYFPFSWHDYVPGEKIEEPRFDLTTGFLRDGGVKYSNDEFNKVGDILFQGSDE